MKSIERWQELIRWRDWGFDKLPLFFMVAFYVALADTMEMQEFMYHFFIFVVLITTMAMYGYLVNDLGDIELDLRHGKSNAFHGMGRYRGALVVVSIVVVMILATLPFLDQAWFVPLMLLWFLGSTFYSLPPVRLKERGWPGLVASLTAQLSLPVLITFAAFSHGADWQLMVFLAYVTCKGISLDVGHQRYDMHRDASTGTATFAVRQGYRSVTRLYGWTLRSERLLLGIVLIAMAPVLPRFWFLGMAISSILPLILIYIGLLLLTFIQGRGQLLDPYYEGRKDVSNLLHAVFPNFVVPFYLLLLLVLQDSTAVWLIAFFLVWTLPLPRKLSWPIRILLGGVKTSRNQR